jgi:hypothetical protein
MRQAIIAGWGSSTCFANAIRVALDPVSASRVRFVNDGDGARP